MNNKQSPGYEELQVANRKAFEEILRGSRPDLHALMNILDDTGINWTIPWKVIEHLHRIGTSTQYGKVVVEIENNTVRFVRGEAATKMNEPLMLDGKTPVGMGAANQKT